MTPAQYAQQQAQITAEIHAICNGNAEYIERIENYPVKAKESVISRKVYVKNQTLIG